MQAPEPKRRGRPRLQPGESTAKPVCTLRLASELHPVLRALQSAGRLEPYLRRMQRAMQEK